MNLTGFPQINGAIAQTGGISGRPLSPGDTLRGVVQRVENGSAYIRLAGGGELVAQLGEGVAVAEGDAIQLRVTSRAEGRLTMQLTHLTGAQASQVAAEAQGDIQLTLNQPILPDDIGARISGWLKQYGVTPGRESIAKARALMEAYPQMDIRTAAFLTANGLTAQSAGTPQMDALVNALMAHYTSAQSNPIGALLAAMEGLGQASPIESILIAGTAVGEIVPDQPANGTGAANAAPTDAAPSPGAPQAQAAQPGVAAPQDASQGALPAAPQADIPTSLAGQTLPAAAQSLPEGTQVPATPLDGAAMPLADFSSEAQQAIQRYFQQAAPQTARALVAAEALPLAAQAIQTAAALPPEAGQALLQNLSTQMALPQDGLPALMRAADALRALSGQPPLTDAAAARLFAQGVAANLTPSSAEAQSAAGELNRAVSTLITNLSTIRQALSSAPEQPAALLAAQAEARAGALPSITQFHYMQIPVTMYERQQMADLYVMKRSRGAAAEKDEYAIAIALETENIGRVEALIRARDKEVDITFRMPPGEAADAVRQSFDDLGDAIRDSGYTLRSAILARLDQPLTPQTFQRQMDQEELKLYTLDVMA